MNILFIEPFYSGSHKTWLDQLIINSKHSIQKLTMEGKFWKWRMYGSAYTMAELFKQKIAEGEIQQLDTILVSDMLDLSTFLSLMRDEVHLVGSPTIGTYFHENQFAYPWQESGEDKQLNRDVHYGMMNYNTALVSDYLLFNSQYNLDSFLMGLSDTLEKMPDYSHISNNYSDNVIHKLRAKSTVIGIGINPPASTKTLRPELEKKINKRSLILWNHRLEYDKNPKGFLECLIQVSKTHDFALAFLGEMNNKALKNYQVYLDQLQKNIVALGYMKYEDYCYLLHRSDILPVTSQHDFFGISVMEAVYCHAIPLLPKGLSYVELYEPENNPEIFYSSKDELVDKIKRLIDHKPSKDYAPYGQPYLWSNIINKYDSFFEQSRTKPLNT